MGSRGPDFNSSKLSVGSAEIEIINEHLISDIHRPKCGDETVSHYVDPDGDVSFEGAGAPTEWLVSDTTAVDLLEGDGR